MSRWQGMATIAIGVLLVLVSAPIGAGQQRASSTLTDQDRVQIQELSAGYGRALGLCEAEAYAGLFVAPDGYFASGPRGRVAGGDKLIALVRSERHCNDNSERRPRNVPANIVIEPSPQGATGNVPLANAGHYEDTYVKTAQGWRFKDRTYISPQEEAAKLTASDFNDIRTLAGNDSGPFDDVYSSTPQGKQFRSSGVVIAPSSDGATGRAQLKNDGGRYDDIYVKTPQGWRYKSRVYVAAGESGGAASAHAAQSSGPVR